MFLHRSACCRWRFQLSSLALPETSTVVGHNPVFCHAPIIWILLGCSFQTVIPILKPLSDDQVCSHLRVICSRIYLIFILHRLLMLLCSMYACHTRPQRFVKAPISVYLTQTIPLSKGEEETHHNLGSFHLHEGVDRGWRRLTTNSS